MKRDFLLGGTKLPTGGAVRGAGGAMSPPVFMLKEALDSGSLYLINCHISPSYFSVYFVFFTIFSLLLFPFSFNSQGSVIVSFTITFSSSSHIGYLTNAINDGKIGNLFVSLVKIVNNMGKYIYNLVQLLFIDLLKEAHI